MWARLSVVIPTARAALSVGSGGAADAIVAAAKVDEAVEGVEPASAERVGSAESEWPDETAEAAFLAESRDPSEAQVTAKTREEDDGESEPRQLPDLDGLVQRISPEVRSALDELFRARFVRVVRVPRKALKT